MKLKTSTSSRAALLCFVALLATPSLLVANTARIPALAAMELVGEARMQALFWNIYDAQLYAPDGTWSGEGSYALSLTYLRDLEGRQIAERSIQEIRGQGFADERTLARWYELLVAIIPDVRDQDEIVGVADDDAHTRFYLDGELIGEIPEPAFTRAFFSIWLGEKSSQPRLRDQLLGIRS